MAMASPPFLVPRPPLPWCRLLSDPRPPRLPSGQILSSPIPRRAMDGSDDDLAPPPPIHHLPPDALHDVLLRLPLRDAVVCRPVSRLLPALRLLLLRHPRPDDGGCLHAFDPDRRCWPRLPFTSVLAGPSGVLLVLTELAALSYAPSDGSGLLAGAGGRCVLMIGGLRSSGNSLPVAGAEPRPRRWRGAVEGHGNWVMPGVVARSREPPPVGFTRGWMLLEAAAGCPRNLDLLAVAHPQRSLRRISSPLPPNLEPGCNAVRVYGSRKETGGLNTLSWRIAISFRDLVVENCYLLWGLVAREKRQADALDRMGCSGVGEVTVIDEFEEMMQVAVSLLKNFSDAICEPDNNRQQPPVLCGTPIK